MGGALYTPKRTCPEKTRLHLYKSLLRTVRPVNAKRMTKPVAAQATTTKRAAITPAQQWRYHKVIFGAVLVGGARQVPPFQLTYHGSFFVCNFMNSSSIKSSPSCAPSTRRPLAEVGAAPVSKT